MTSDIDLLLQSMTQEVRDNLATAVEIGKWPDGTTLTEEQRGNAMQAVMLWDSQNGQEEDEPFKVLKGGKLIRQQEKKPTASKSSSEDDNSQNIDIRWQ